MAAKVNTTGEPAALGMPSKLRKGKMVGRANQSSAKTLPQSKIPTIDEMTTPMTRTEMRTKPLGEQALALKLEEEGEEEGDRRQNQEDRLVGGENPARGDLARDETDGRDDRAGDDGRDEFTQSAEHAGEADDGLERAADEDRAHIAGKP